MREQFPFIYLFICFQTLVCSVLELPSCFVQKNLMSFGTRSEEPLNDIMSCFHMHCCGILCLFVDRELLSPAYLGLFTYCQLLIYTAGIDVGAVPIKCLPSGQPCLHPWAPIENPLVSIVKDGSPYGRGVMTPLSSPFADPGLS